VPRLSDIEPAELSLVHRGAIRRSFNVRKAADALPAETLEVLDTAAAGEDEFVKQLADIDADHGRGLVAAYRLVSEHTGADPAAIAKAMSDLVPVEKAKYTADQLHAMAKSGAALPDESYPIGDKDDLQKAIHAVGRGKNNSHADIRAHIAKRAKALGGTDLIPDSWNVSKEDPTMTDTATVPVKKEDGTWDLSAVPEDQHEFMKEILEKADRAEAAEAEKSTLEKAAADAEASKDDALKVAEEARTIAKAEKDKRETAEFITKAEELGESEEFGPVLKAIAGSVDDDTFAKLEAVLKANHERAVTAGFYEEIGKAGKAGGESGAKAQLDEKAAEIRKADTSLTAEQALAKAYEDNPELYAQLRNEEN
jgi:hypothetical protein